MTNNPATPTQDDKERKEIQQQLDTLPTGRRLSDDEISHYKKLREMARTHKLDISKLNDLLRENNADNEINVDELDNHATAEDGEWKKEVRDAIQKANTKLNNTFNEDQNDTKHLTFKDGENTISFSSPNDAYVKGEQKAFDELVVAAKEMGKTSIKFGKFEKHPEYKAMLYLACLKHGMESDAPDLSDLKDNPKAQKALKGLKDIISQCSQEAEDKLTKAKTDFLEAVSNPKTDRDKELQKLFDKINEAKKNPQNSEEIANLKERIRKHPLGEALYEAVENRAKIMKRGVELGVISDDEVTKYSTPKSSSEKNDQNTFGNSLNMIIAQKARPTSR